MEKRTGSKVYHAFLSHNKKDKAIVEKIALWLTKKAGLKVWLDKWNLIPGDSWLDDIAKALDQSQCCVVFLGPHGISAWQHTEMRSAVDSRVSENSMRVLPVLLPRAVRPGRESELPRFLRDHTWVVFKETWQEEETLRRLVCGIEGKEPGPSPIEIEIEEGECPFRGLEIFREQDRRFFFGREVLAQRLLAKLEHSRFLCVTGPSGCGKSSLVQAGLLAPLRWQAEAVVFTPRLRPVEELAFALHGAYTGKDVPPAEDLLARLNKPGNMLHFLGREIVDRADGKDKLLIVIDQFEELFTQTAVEVERRRFISLLLEAVDVLDGPVTVILTLRSDFIGKCAYYKELNMFVIDHLVQVEPMGEAELRRVIEEPARLVGLGFDDGLVNRVLADVKDAPGELPLLEHALLELYENRRGNLLTSQAYDEIGGITGALVNRAEAEYAKLENEEKEILRKMFVLRLIQPGEGTEDTRRRASREELLAAGETPEKVEKVLDRWIKARLLTASRDAAREKEMVDVAHEALIRRWDRMAAWMAEDREASRLTGVLRRAALEWKEADRDPAYLFQGVRLSRMEGLLEAFAANLTADEIAFVRAGVEQREAVEREKERQQQRELQAAQALASTSQKLAAANSRAVKRARVIMAVIILGLLSVLYLLYNVNIKEKNTRRQLAINYWDNSRSAREKGDTLLAFHLFAEAVNVNPEPLLLKTLLSDMNHLWNCYPPVYIFQHKELGKDAIFNADGTRILTWDNGHTARLWETSTGKTIGSPMVHKSDVIGAIFNADETRILTWSGDLMGFWGTSRLWDAATGKPIGSPMVHERAVLGARFNASETRILTWSADLNFFIEGILRLWDAATGKPIGSPMVNGGVVFGARFNSDETRILTCSADNTARLWETATGKPIGQAMVHGDDVYEAVFNSDETRILTCSADNTARLWDTATGKPIGQAMVHGDDVYEAVFNSDETLILSRSGDGTARLWDGVTGKPIGSPMVHEGDVYDAIFNADGTRILTWSRDKTARLWDGTTGKPIGLPMVHKGHVGSARFNADETHIITWSGDKTACFWAVAANKPANLSMLNEGGIRNAVFNVTGTRILTWNAGYGEKGSGRLWDGATGEPIGSPMRYGAFASEAIFNTNGTRILTWSEDNTARLWDGVTGKPIGLPMVHEGDVYGALFNADGTRILTRSMGCTARLWDGVTGKPIGLPMVHEGHVNGALFNSDGTRILTWSWDNTARLWDGTTGKPVGSPMAHKETVCGAIFNSDETRILTWSNDYTVRLWDGVTGKPIGLPMVHEDDVSGAIFNADDTRILTWSDDKTARFWDSTTGKPIGDPMVHKDDVMGAAFNIDETRILTWSGDGTAKLWDVGVDWDFPPDKIKLQVMALTATELDPLTRGMKVIDPERWYKIRDEYIKIARQHLKTCKYPQSNVYRKLNLEKVWNLDNK